MNMKHLYIYVYIATDAEYITRGQGGGVEYILYVWCIKYMWGGSISTNAGNGRRGRGTDRACCVAGNWSTFPFPCLVPRPETYATYRMTKTRPRPRPRPRPGCVRTSLPAGPASHGHPSGIAGRGSLRARWYCNGTGIAIWHRAANRGLLLIWTRYRVPPALHAITGENTEYKQTYI